ncbi:MAG TPA: SIS domain-containing protein [Acidimicrobiales bacterium]
MSPEATDFLYPFIEGGEQDARVVLADLEESARVKGEESLRLAESTLEEHGEDLDAVAEVLAARSRQGGVLFTFGNGGSATDAQRIAGLFAGPPVGHPVAARCLVDDPAVLTALSNDVGFDLVFSRQLMAHGQAGDTAMGLSTSGDSANLLEAFGESRRRGLLTIAVAGGGGGRCATSPDVDHCLVVRSASVHRIQEVQAELVLELWARVQRRLDVTW